MIINESAENYLETILVLSGQLPVVRSVDIANELGFSKPSISIAVKNLKEHEYITVTPEGYIYLTQTGFQIAQNVYERHQVLTDALMKLVVTAEPADEDGGRCYFYCNQRTSSYKIEFSNHRNVI